jgi:hypothetical protein
MKYRLDVVLFRVSYTHLVVPLTKSSHIQSAKVSRFLFRHLLHNYQWHSAYSLSLSVFTILYIGPLTQIPLTAQAVTKSTLVIQWAEDCRIFHVTIMWLVQRCATGSSDKRAIPCKAYCSVCSATVGAGGGGSTIRGICSDTCKQ